MSESSQDPEKGRHRPADVTSLPPPFASHVHSAQKRALNSRTLSLVAFAFSFFFLAFGAVLSFMTGAPQLFLFFFVVAALGGLSVHLFGKHWQSHRFQRSLKKTYEPFLTFLSQGSQGALAQSLKNCLSLAPRAARQNAYLVELVGEGFDFVLRSVIMLRSFRSPSVPSAADLEENVAAAEALFIHLNEGLVTEAEEVAKLLPKLRHKLGHAESQARFLEASLHTEASLLEDARAVESLLLSVLGQRASVVQKKIEDYLERRKTRRSSIFANYSQLFQEEGHPRNHD